MNADARMYKRRIVCVLSWFDEEHDCPWDYIQRSGDGRFEAIATHVLDDAAHERLIGCFDTEAEAVKALRGHLRMVEIAEGRDEPLPAIN
jgi:hypothetical protein